MFCIPCNVNVNVRPCVLDRPSFSFFFLSMEVMHVDTNEWTDRLTAGGGKGARLMYVLADSDRETPMSSHDPVRIVSSMREMRLAES